MNQTLISLNSGGVQKSELNEVQDSVYLHSMSQPAG